MYGQKRLYAKDVERIFGVRILGKEGLKGKGLDGITAKQKQTLHSLGMNTSEFRYKGEACRAITFLLWRKNHHLPSLWAIMGGADPFAPIAVAEAKQFFRVKKLSPFGNTASPEVFTTESEAEYHAAKHVPPELDAEIISFVTNEYYVVETAKPRYFIGKANARLMAERLHVAYKHA